MWSVHLSRKDFFEFYLGGFRRIESRISSGVGLKFGQGDAITMVWEDDPAQRSNLPSLVVAPDGQVGEILSLVLSAPQAPSPLTSLSRVISRTDAISHFESDVIPLNQQLFPTFAILTFVEAMLHAGGRLSLGQLSPLICRKTLTFAWGKALVSKVPAASIRDLPDRWLSVYGFLNGQASVDTVKPVLENMVSILVMCSELMIGVKPKKKGGRLAYELLWGTKVSQEQAWTSLAERLENVVGLDVLHSQNREERGLHLQRALKGLGASSRTDDNGADLIAACAFLATRLSPGSLDHFEILRSVGRPELIAWYAMYAALQSPQELLLARSGIGFRILKEMLTVEEKLAPPVADISFEEISILTRVNTDLTSTLSHSGELGVELIPYVCSSFSFISKSKARTESATYGESNLYGDGQSSIKDRLTKLARELDRLSREVGDTESYKRRGKSS